MNCWFQLASNITNTNSAFIEYDLIERNKNLINFHLVPSVFVQSSETLKSGQAEHPETSDCCYTSSPDEATVPSSNINNKQHYIIHKCLCTKPHTASLITEIPAHHHSAKKSKGIPYKRKVKQHLEMLCQYQNATIKDLCF